MLPPGNPDTKPQINPSIAFAFALLLVLLAGLIDVRKPFTGDQALFVTGARAMLNGSALYTDFWDLKQPGIYWFYWLGIHLPGSAEVAVHSLEILYFTVFAITIQLGLRKYFRSSVTAAIASVLCCGVYFIICESWHLTQVEGLVGFPLYLCAWLLLGGDPRQPTLMGRIFLAGICAAVVLLMKLILVVLPGCFLVLLIAWRLFNGRSPLRSGLIVLAFAGGMCAVVLPLAAYYVSTNHLTVVYNTFIAIPIRITRELPHNKLVVFKSGIEWFASRLGPLLLLAVMGFWKRKKNLFSIGLATWIVGGLALIGIQRMGWQYHFLLLLCPIAILAASGIESVFVSPHPRRTLQAVAILLVLPYVGIGLIQAVRQLHDHRPWFYAKTLADAEILSRASAKTGSIYVMGDPLIYYLSGRTQAVAINGWSPEWLLPDQWQELAFKLRATRPAYIFVDDGDKDVLAVRGKAFTKMLTEGYRVVSTTADGVWYAVDNQPINSDISR